MSLGHVLWLGGSACAGKSSVARLVAAELGLALYSCDDHFEAHRRRADPVRHPGFHRLMDVPMEELWARPAAVQADELIRFYQDEFEMVSEDLAALPRPVLAEGVGLLPERVAAVRPDPHRAAWLISTPAFRRRVYPGRGPFVRDLLSRCADPEQTFARWMERDDRIAGRLAEDARRLGLEVITVEGGQSLAETARRLAERFR